MTRFILVHWNSVVCEHTRPVNVAAEEEAEVAWWSGRLVTGNNSWKMERTPEEKTLSLFLGQEISHKSQVEVMNCPLSNGNAGADRLLCHMFRLQKLFRNCMNPGTLFLLLLFIFFNIQRHFLVILLKFELSHHHWIHWIDVVLVSFVQTDYMCLDSCCVHSQRESKELSPKSESVEAPVKTLGVISRTSGSPTPLARAWRPSTLFSSSFHCPHLDCVTYFTITFSLVCISQI